MDEVLAVGDVGFRMKCFAHLNRLIKSGVSIILVTHAVGMLQRVATRSVVFGQGKIVHDGDLETGCTIYEEMLGGSDRDRSKKKEVAGKTHVGDVEVCNHLGQPQKEFETGESVKLRVNLNTIEPVKNARLVVALCSPVHGVLSSISTSYQQVRFDVDAPGSVVTLEFPEIPLLIGSYHFNISLLGPGPTDFYHRSSLRGVFRIVGPPTDANGYGLNGITTIRHGWKVNGQT